MEAHAGTVRIPTPTRAKPRRRGRLLELLRELSRAQRERAIQAHERQGALHSRLGAHPSCCAREASRSASSSSPREAR